MSTDLKNNLFLGFLTLSAVLGYGVLSWLIPLYMAIFFLLMERVSIVYKHSKHFTAFRDNDLVFWLKQDLGGVIPGIFLGMYITFSLGKGLFWILH